MRGGVAVWCSAWGTRCVDRDAARKARRSLFSADLQRLEFASLKTVEAGASGTARISGRFSYVQMKEAKEARTSANQTADYSVGPGLVGGK